MIFKRNLTNYFSSQKAFGWRVKFSFLLFASLLLFSFNSVAEDPIHDPSNIIKGEDGRYYIFSTGNGIYCISSTNTSFTDRRVEPTPLDPNNYPKWIDNYVSGFGGNFWAPDIIYMDGYYYLYYSASQWGTSYSAIGVLRSDSLASPHWEDQGMVVYSSGHSTDINAIDPSLLMDSDGKVWMSYGSWSGGIGVIEINPSTGKAIGSVTHVAGGNSQAYEGSDLMKNGDFYYLFVNRGTCCNGIASGYYVEVSRSTNVKGPYTGVREFLPNKYGNVIGPGHVDYGEGTLTYHYYDGFSNGFPRLMTTTLDFVNGWPVAGSNGVTLANINGKYALIATNSNKAIGMPSAVANNGTNIAQYTYTGDASQQFIIRNEEGKWHVIKSVIDTTKSFDVYEMSIDNGANINLWDYWGGANQLFCFQETGTAGNYRIMNNNSGRYLDITNASTADGANLNQWGGFPVAPQQTFRLIDLTSTGVDENNLASIANIFPNPSHGIFTVRIEQSNASLRILTLQGKKVFEKSIQKGATKITTNLNSGFYLLVIQSNSGTGTQKLLIQRQ